MRLNLILAASVAWTLFEPLEAPRQTTTPGAAPAPRVVLQPGDAAPPLTLDKLLQAPEPATATWDALRGRVVVLEFWATWCGPCINLGLPHLNQVAEAVAERPVTFISITDEGPERVEPFLKRKPMRGWIGLDPDRTTFDAYGVNGIPQTCVVDAQGRLVFNGAPMQVTAALLERVLAGEADAIIESSRQEAEQQRERDREFAEAELVEPAYAVVVRKLAAAPRHFRTSRGSGANVKTYESFGPGMRGVLADVWSFSPQQIDVPSAIESVALKVDAVIPTRPGLSAEAIRTMLASKVEEALAAALGVTVRREARPTTLLVLRPRPGWEEKMPRGQEPASLNSTPGMVSGQGMPLMNLGQALQRASGQMVIVEAPEADGPRNFQVRWDSADPASLAAAIESQLGLAAAQERRTVEHLVVEPAKDASR
jgi:thiol-disulfide isomerase/thioredoxin